MCLQQQLALLGLLLLTNDSRDIMLYDRITMTAVLIPIAVIIWGLTTCILKYNKAAKLYSHQDPSAGSPVRDLQDDNSSLGYPDGNACKDEGTAQSGPGPECCKTLL